MKQIDINLKPELQFIYDQHGKAIYSMIRNCVKDEAASEKIFESVLIKLEQESMVAQLSCFKIMAFTRQATREFLEANKHDFRGHPYLRETEAIDNNYLLRLLCVGRYTISQLCRILGMEELALRKRIRVALEELRNNSGKGQLIASMN